MKLIKLISTLLIFSILFAGSCGGGSSDDSDAQAAAFSFSDIPGLPAWEDNMRTFGQNHCKEIRDSAKSFDDRLAASYYDAILVYSKIYQHTGDSSWIPCISGAKEIYRDRYVIANNGKVPGYWNFTEGLTRDFEKRGDQISKKAAILLSTQAAFAVDDTPLSSTTDSLLSREVAYAIVSYLDAERLGQPRRPRLEQLVDQALGHLDQWFVRKSAPYIRPFMVALTARALIMYQEVTSDPRILPALRNAADWLWEHTWNQNHKAFQYTDRKVESGGTELAPDLNLLIAPMYAWIYRQTGILAYRQHAEMIFDGGVSGAYVQGAKQFNQNYFWSFELVSWLKQGPKSQTAPALPVTPINP